MSIKYNRNDANAASDKFYIDDYKIEINSLEQDLRDALLNFQKLPAIVSGGDLTPEAYPGTNITVAACTARDKDGKPAIITTQQVVIMTNTSGGHNYVILRHKYSYDTARFAFETGTSYYTRKYDDFELSVAETYVAGDVVLGDVKREGSANVLYVNERTPRPLKFSSDNLQFVGAGSGNATIQQAVDAATTGIFTLVALLPGQYDTAVNLGSKTIGILGLGRVVIGPTAGRIYSSGAESNLVFLSNVIVQCASQSYPDVVQIKNVLGEKLYLEHVKIIGTGTSAQNGLHISGNCSPVISGLRVRMQTGYGVKIDGVTGNVKAEISGHGIQCSENPIKLDNGGSDVLRLQVFDTSLKAGTSKYCIAGTNNERVTMANCRYNESPDEEHLTLTFGVLHNISNTKFPADALEVLP